MSLSNTTIVAGSLGAAGGALAGFLIGKALATKDPGLDMMPELLAILAAIGGGVAASALVNATPTANPAVASSSTAVTPTGA
jgi:hypothetical protein